MKNNTVNNENKANNIELNEIGYDLQKGNEHLNSYFKSLKNKHISHLIETINEIESAYDQSYHRNVNILQFIELLIDNYEESKDIILNNKINVYQCDNPNNISNVIRYYNQYYINQKIKTQYLYQTQIEFTMSSVNKEKDTNFFLPDKKRNKRSDLKVEKIIDNNSNRFNSLILLNDNRIASCSYKEIRIYNPSNDYHCEQVIKRHNDWIYSICQLPNDDIVSCSNDKSIIIGDYTINNAHNDIIKKVITIPNNRIASC